MTENLILGRIKAGNFQDLDDLLLDYLSAAQRDENAIPEQKSRYTLFTVQVLQSAMPHLTTCRTEERSKLLSGIHICCNFYHKTRDSLKLPDPLTVHKILYHIVAKLLDKDLLDDAYTICVFLYEELLPLPDITDTTTSSIVKNVYSKLWNMAIKLEQERDQLRFETTLRLRYMAIKVLLLGQSSVANAVEKFILAIDRFDKVALKKKIQPTVKYLTIELVSDIIQCIINMESSSGISVLTETDVCSTASLIQYLNQFIVTHQLRDIIECVHQRTKGFLVTFQHFKFCGVMESLYKMLNFLCHSSNSSSLCEVLAHTDIDSLSVEVTELLEQCHLNTGWFLLICECILVILKQSQKLESGCSFSAIEVLKCTRKLTLLLYSKKEQGHLHYEEDSEEKNKKLAVAIETKMLSMCKSQLEIGVSVSSKPTDKDRILDFLHTTREISEMYASLIDLNSSALNPDVKQRERRQFGYLTSKFAQLSYSSGQQDLAIYYYTVECKQLTLWAESVNSPLKEQRMKEEYFLEICDFVWKNDLLKQSREEVYMVNLCKIYQMLADLHHKSSNIESAYDTLRKSVELDSNSAPTAINMWSIIKRNQLREGKTNLAGRFFVDGIEKNAECDEYRLIKLELQDFSSARKRYPEEELSLLTKLYDACSTPLQRAECQLERAKLFWAHPTEEDNRSVKDYLCEARNLLASSTDEDKSPVLAEIYLWTYITRHENLCKQLIDSSQKVVESEECAEPGEDAQTSSTVVMEMMYTFSMEKALMRHLDTAVQLWETCLEKLDMSDRGQSCLKSLVLCSSIYRLSGKINEEQRTLCLALNLCKSLGDNYVRNLIQCRLASIYNLHGIHHIAQQLLPEVPDSDHQARFDEGYTQSVVANVFHYLQTKQLQKGLDLLQTFGEVVSQQQNRNKYVCMAEGLVKRLRSMFMSLPSNHQTVDVINDYSLELAIDAYRNHVSVIHFMLGKDNWAAKGTGNNSTEKFDILQEYLWTLYHLGKLNRLIGDMRSAKFYIKEGWTTAHFIGLPKWVVVFLNEFSVIHMLYEDKEAALVCLKNTNRLFLDNDTSNFTIEDLKLCNLKNSRKDGSAAFGFEETNDTIMSYDRNAGKAIPCWNHIKNKEFCEICQDSAIKLAVISYSVVLAKYNKCFLQSDSTQILEDIVSVCKGLDSHDMQLKNHEIDFPRCCMSDSADLKEVYLETLTVLAEIHLLNGNTEKSLDVISLAQDFIASQCVNVVDTNHLQNRFMVYKAQICFMKTVPQLTDPDGSMEAECVTESHFKDNNMLHDNEGSNIGSKGVINEEQKDNPDKASVDCTVEGLSQLSLGDNSPENSQIVTKTKTRKITTKQKKEMKSKVTEPPAIAKKGRKAVACPLSKSSLTKTDLDLLLDSSDSDDDVVKPCVRKKTVKKVTGCKTEQGKEVAGQQKKTSSSVNNQLKKTSKNGVKNVKSLKSKEVKHSLENSSSSENLSLKTNGDVKSVKTISKNMKKNKKTHKDEDQDIEEVLDKETVEDSSHLETPPNSDVKKKVLKTPFSVCSRKAACLLSDSSDEESLATKAKRKRKTANAKTDNQIKKPLIVLTNMKPAMSTRNVPELSSSDNCSSANTTPVNLKCQGRSRIPRYIKKTKSKVEYDLKSEDLSIESNSSNCALKSRNHTKSKVEVKKTEKTKTRTRKNLAAVTEIENKEESKVKENIDHVYDFSENEILSETKKPQRSGTRKVKATDSKLLNSTNCKKVRRGRLNRETETTRGKVEEDKKSSNLDIGRQMDYFTIVNESFNEHAKSNTEPSELSIEKTDDLQDSVETKLSPLKIDMIEKTDDMQDIFLYSHLDASGLSGSIEIPRGNEDKKSRGRTAKGKPVSKKSVRNTGNSKAKVQPSKANKAVSSEVTMNEEITESTDTSGDCVSVTEISRSTRHVSMPLQVNSIKKEASAPKTTTQNVEAGANSDRDELISMLETAFVQARHLPTTGLYTSICNMLALQYLDVCPQKAAYYMAEGIVVTFRHQSLVNCSRKIRKFRREINDQTEIEEDDKVTDIQNSVKKNLMFNKTPADIDSIVQDLPDDWRICQISMVTNPQVPDQMLLSCLRKNRQPIVVELPISRTVQGRNILSEFAYIMEQNRTSMKISDREEWWQKRRQLDDKLREMLEHMDKYWLSHWRCLLQGTVSVTEEDEKKLDVIAHRLATEIDHISNVKPSIDILKSLIEAITVLSDRDIKSAMCDLTGLSLSSPEINQCLSVIKKLTEDQLSSTKGHVLLILDKSVQHLPWECVPSLQNTNISRMPSLYHFHAHLSYLISQKSSILKTGIDRKKVYYVLNPDSNLPGTQENFEDWFKNEEEWEGIINSKPTEEQYTKALQEKDLFLYCGHGSGGKYLGADDLSSMQCRAAAILMGCSSGKLTATGHLEATGLMLNYFMAGCPCMVANLWDVTDKDIDRFLTCLLSLWLSDTKGQKTLLDLIPKARSACVLPHLIGAAPVVYGFPVFLKSSKKSA